jgi:hypothetical protein
LNKFIIVKCLCIDELIYKFNYVDLIKIYIKGHEYSIIPSLIKNINKYEKFFAKCMVVHIEKSLKKIFNFGI